MDRFLIRSGYESIDRDGELELNNQEVQEKYKLELHPDAKRVREQPQIEQRTEEWFAARREMITSSKIGIVVGEKKYGSINKLFHEQANLSDDADAVPFRGIACDWGSEFENVAARVYEKKHNCKILDVGLLRHRDHPEVGGSPDGIVAQTGVGIEIKCPFGKRDITVILPEGYAQAQMNMEVMDVDTLDFIQFRPANPILETEMEYYEERIYRDRSWWQKHKNTILEFIEEVKEAKKTQVIPKKYEIKKRKKKETQEPATKLESIVSSVQETQTQPQISTFFQFTGEDDGNLDYNNSEIWEILEEGVPMNHEFFAKMFLYKTQKKHNHFRKQDDTCITKLTPTVSPYFQHGNNNSSDNSS